MDFNSGPAKETAEDVALEFVGGENAVFNQKGGGFDVVGDDAEGDSITIF